MKYLECMIVWNTGETCKVGPWPGDRVWHKGFRKSIGGGCIRAHHQMTPEQRNFEMLADFICIVRDGVDVKQALAEFTKIEEFRDLFGDEI
jgi:hypothetical protein